MSKILILAMALLIASVAAAQDWPVVNHDISMSRNSPQSAVVKENVNQLQIRCIHSD